MLSALVLGAWLALIGVVPWFRAVSARADAPPADVVSIPGRVIEVPTLPADFVSKRVGSVDWAYHPSATSLAHDLAAGLPERFREVAKELGATISGDLMIRIARGPEDMAALAPRSAPPPRYAVGVAYPALGLIILSVVEPNSWLPPDLGSVLTHELSHVALYRATKGQPLPLWFVEGLAVHQAREQNLARIQTVWQATLAGELMPLSELSRSFPATPHAVNLAYAQSADLVGHMLRETRDRAALHTLVERLAAGTSFDRALLAAYKLDLSDLDRAWRQSLRERFHLTPWVLTGSVLWGGIAVLVVVAFARRRRQHREKLARWAEEEDRHERAQAALELQRLTLAREELAAAARIGSAMTDLGGEAEVPTIEYDGQHHTLH